MSGILLLSTWGSASLALARSCRRQNLPVYLLEPHAQKCRWKWYTSCLSGGRAIRGRDMKTPEGVGLIRDYARAVSARALAATDDACLLWLARNRGVFEPDCKLLMPAAEVLDLTRSKRNQIDVANQVGFDVLPTFYVSEARDCHRVPASAYPIVVRPDQKTGPRSPFKVRLLKHPAELESLADAWDGTCGPLIAQPFLDLPNLIVHGARTESGTVLVMETFFVPRKLEGVTLTIRPAKAPPGVEQSCRDFVEAAGITGCFHFELLLSEDGQRAWFLEINARLGGTTSKVARLGFDEASYLLAAYGIQPPPRGEPRLSQRLAGDRRALLKHLFRALRGKLTEFDYPPGSRLRRAGLSLRDLWLVKDSLIDWRDVRGSFWWSRRREAPP